MATDIRVITFNTAVGNPRITTAQPDFLELPFYREVIEGAPEAAIIALQEVGPEQAQALKAAAGEGGRFAVVHIQRPRQGNALLIPERYTLVGKRSRYFIVSQLWAFARAIWRGLTRRARVNWRQYLELRMWSEARLRDEASGCPLTVFNTHLSGEAPLRLAQARSLFRRVHRARGRGPVVLAGDLNMRPGSGADVAPLVDMAAGAADPRRPAIDWILAAGFEPVGARLYTDDALSLPGSPMAELVSDHYAKEAAMRLA